MNYQKHPISIEQQIALLKQRGLIIDDEPLALDRLKVISYFRLADYWRPMEADHTTHSFLPNTHFVDVLACYYFDKQLKMLLFSAVQTIEIAVRTAIIHHFSMQHGAFWFIDATLFTDQSLFGKHTQILGQSGQKYGILTSILGHVALQGINEDVSRPRRIEGRQIKSLESVWVILLPS